MLRENPIILSAGPAGFPTSVLEEAARAVVSLGPSQPSILSISHRSPQFSAIIHECNDLIREMLSLPSDYSILWMQGGATLQFAAAVLNILSSGGAATLCSGSKGHPPSAVYCISGAWSKKASEEATKLGIMVHETGVDGDSLGSPCGLTKDRPLYSYVCTNETIHGRALSLAPSLRRGPASEALFHVADMSSDFLARPVPNIKEFDILFAGAQKNLGPAGVTCVVVRQSILKKPPDLVQPRKVAWRAPLIPTMMDYSILLAGNSCYNTPPVYSIYVTLLQLRWMASFRLGALAGIRAIHANNLQKAGLLYKTIDDSRYFCAPVVKGLRSITNIVFRIRDPADGIARPDLEKNFAHLAAVQENMIGLEGHRCVGGLRASLYNSVSMNDVRVLAEFIVRFDAQHWV